MDPRVGHMTQRANCLEMFQGVDPLTVNRVAVTSPIGNVLPPSSEKSVAVSPFGARQP